MRSKKSGNKRPRRSFRSMILSLTNVFSFERQGETHELTLRWIPHHLIDHEAQQKGQILMLKRLSDKR